MSNNPLQAEPEIVVEWRKEERQKLWFRIIRLGIGVPLILFSYPWPGVLSPFLVLLGCVLVAPEAVGLLSSMIEGMLWPHHESKPKPLYGIPETLAAKGKYAEAEQEYEKIIQQFPDAIKPHVDMINIAITRLNDVKLAEKLYQRGMDSLHVHESRETLTRMYEAIKTRLKEKKTWDRSVKVSSFSSVPKETSRQP